MTKAQSFFQVMNGLWEFDKKYNFQKTDAICMILHTDAKVVTQVPACGDLWDQWTFGDGSSIFINAAGSMAVVLPEKTT